MSIQGIFFYTLRAAIFAAAVCAVYALVCKLRKRKIRWLRLLGIAYLAALIQITVIRGGADWARVFAGRRARPQLVPLRTTLAALRSESWWSFVYHTMGNVVWFVPLGLMLQRRKPWTALLAGAILSACIELGQYLLMTGMTDIDDIILNALGALLGWLLTQLFRSFLPKRRAAAKRLHE